MSVAASYRPTTSTLRRVAGVLLLVSGVALFVVEAVAIAVSHAPYDLTEQAVSDLGVTACGPLATYSPPLEVCSPAHPAVNLVWILTGVAVAIGAWLLRPAGRLTTVGTVLICAAALLQTGVGLVPTDVSLVGHLLLGLFGFGAQVLGMLGLGVGLLLQRRTRRHGVWVSMLATLALLGGLGVVLVVGGASDLGLGTTERLLLYPFQTWMILTGTVALRRPAVPDPVDGG